MQTVARMQRCPSVARIPHRGGELGATCPNGIEYHQQGGSVKGPIPVIGEIFLRQLEWLELIRCPPKSRIALRRKPPPSSAAYLTHPAHSGMS